MALERCPECNALGSHLDGCSKTPQASPHDEHVFEATSDLTSGALWFFGGLVFTALGYGFASVVGGGYFVAYGAVLYGAIKMLRGLIQGFRNRPDK